MSDVNVAGTPWDEESDLYLRRNYGSILNSSIASHLGRTPRAVIERASKINAVRHPHVDPAFLTEARLVTALGVGRDVFYSLMKREPEMIVNGKRVPVENKKVSLIGAEFGTRSLRGIYRKDLLDWLSDPLNHWWLRGLEDGIIDREIRDVVFTARKSWDDEWMRSKTAAEAFYVIEGSVLYHLRKGKFPSSVYWGGWNILRSEIELARPQWL